MSGSEFREGRTGRGPAQGSQTSISLAKLDGDQAMVPFTAHARAQDRQRILPAGSDGYVPKPLELSDVVRITRSVTGPGASP